MISSKSLRIKLGHALYFIFSTFLLLLLLALIVIWAVLLAYVADGNTQSNFTCEPNTLIVLPNCNLSLQSNALTVNPSSVHVFQITNLAIPLLFTVIGLIGVILHDAYWCAISGLVLFVFWILDHQRDPTLFVDNSANPFEVLILVAHALHLAVWCFLLIYGGLVVLHWRMRTSTEARTWPRPPAVGSTMPPIYSQYGSYGGYSRQLSTSRLDAPPYYDMNPTSLPTFETIQIQPTRAQANDGT